MPQVHGASQFAPSARHRRVAGVGLPSALGWLLCLTLLAGPSWGARVWEAYTVRAGDTLSSIARSYGVSVSALCKENGITETTRLVVGDRLVVVRDTGKSPSAAAGRSKTASPDAEDSHHETTRAAVIEVHVVRPGETWTSIATQHGVDAAALRRLNHGGVTPRPGSVLSIPSEESPSPGQSALGSGKAVGRQTAAPGSPTPRTSFTAGGSVGRLATVVRAGGDIRRRPSPKEAVLFRTTVGMQLAVTGQTVDWYAVMMIDRTTGWLPKKYVRLENVELTATQANVGGWQSRVIGEAFRYLGAPYRYGGSSFGGIDCSALVQRCFRTVGRNLPRTAASQFGVGQRVDYRDLAPGDRLYFCAKGRTVDHTGIYLGRGRFIHASGSASRVTVDNLFTTKWWSVFVGARR